MSTDLYRERMLELAAAGDRGTPLDAADASFTVDNPLCGDRVTVEVRRDGGGRIVELGHTVRGCVLCRAAAAVLADHATGHDRDALASVRERVRAHLRGAGALPAETEWRDLAVFEPVAAHRSRHDCVLLPFDAVVQALDED